MNIIRLNSIGEPFAKSEQATPPSGGGTEGGSGLKYYDVANSDSMIKATSLGVASIVKLYNNEWIISPAGVIGIELGFDAVDKVTAFGVDWTMEMLVYGEKQTTKQFFESMETIDSLTEITKEQFYTI